MRWPFFVNFIGILACIAVMWTSSRPSYCQAFAWCQESVVCCSSWIGRSRLGLFQLPCFLESCKANQLQQCLFTMLFLALIPIIIISNNAFLLANVFLVILFIYSFDTEILSTGRYLAERTQNTMTCQLPVWILDHSITLWLVFLYCRMRILLGFSQIHVWNMRIGHICVASMVLIDNAWLLHCFQFQFACIAIILGMVFLSNLPVGKKQGFLYILGRQIEKTTKACPTSAPMRFGWRFFALLPRVLLLWHWDSFWVELFLFLPTYMCL